MNFSKVITNDRLLKATIGMGLSKFEELLVTFTEIWDQYNCRTVALIRQEVIFLLIL